jgi:GTP pyrophosphokinase
VRQWFRTQGRDTAIEQGRDVVDKELGRLALEHTGVAAVAESLKYDSVEDLYAAVGFGDRSPQAVTSVALSLEREKAEPEEPSVPSSVPLQRKRRAPSGISLQGVDDILGKRAACCNPVPGDPVIGFISRGRGLTIHRRDCRHVAGTMERERLVEMDWGPAAGETFLGDVLIRAHDRPGLLRDISGLVSDNGVNMTAARADARPRDGTAALRLTLEFASADQVARLLAKLGQYPGVLEVRRIAK